VRTQNGCRTLCGTPGYLAPEILERWPAYDTKCDLWSVGVILFLLLGGYLPFEDEDEDKVFDRTRNGYYEFHPHYFGKVSNDAKELVTILLTVNPSKRASTEKAMEHKWMKRQGDQLQGKQLNADKLKATIMAKEKIRRAVNTVVVANRMKDLNEGFALYLKNRSDEKPKFSMHPAKKCMLMVDESRSGKPFSDFYEMGELVSYCSLLKVCVFFVVKLSLIKSCFMFCSTKHSWERVVLRQYTAPRTRYRTKSLRSRMSTLQS
jgi:serine/threonine protein kinase